MGNNDRAKKHGQAMSSTVMHNKIIQISGNFVLLLSIFRFTMTLAPTRVVALRYTLFCVTCFLTYGTYYAMLFLQSSINIEGGLGATAATVAYSTSTVLGIFLTPVIIRVAGPKCTMIMCQIGYLSFVLANYYPVGYLLIPTSIASGFAEATMWPVTLLYVLHFARCQARYGSKEVRQYETEYIGYFFMAFQVSQVLANLMSYAILYGGASSIPDVQLSNSSLNTSADLNIAKRLQVCGIHDCQDPNITAANMAQYVPTSMTILYVVFGMMAGLILLSIALHITTTKPIDESKEGENTNMEITQDKEKIELNSVEVPKHEDIVSIKGGSCCGKGGNQDSVALALSAVKATGRHIIRPKLLLIAPITIYCGILLSFGFAEMTRAFASCMLGVDQVGLCMVIFASAAAVVSVLSTKLASRLGVNLAVAIGFVLDIGGYMLCLFWKPNEENLWMVYILFVVVGAVNGVWPPIVNEIHASFFPDDQDVMFTAWNILFLVGYAIQYGWSTTLCVYVKIYIQIGIICISVLGYGIAYMINKKQKNQKV